jgi:hypothetical protein
MNVGLHIFFIDYSIHLALPLNDICSEGELIYPSPILQKRLLVKEIDGNFKTISGKMIVGM